MLVRIPMAKIKPANIKVNPNINAISHSPNGFTINHYDQYK